MYRYSGSTEVLPLRPVRLPQAARLLALFREFKRREAVGLVMFYANRLAALEDSMLGAREKLFALQVRCGAGRALGQRLHAQCTHRHRGQEWMAGRDRAVCGGNFVS